MKRLSVVCLLAFAAVAPVLANIIPVTTSIVETSPGVYAWTYNLQLSSDQNVNSGAAPSVNPVPAVNENRGGFLTIYGFGGYISGSCSSPVGWTCTSQLIGFTPATVLPASDEATLLNITWSYTTGDVIGGQPDGKNLGDFFLLSTFSEPGLVAYTARGIANGGPPSGHDRRQRRQHAGSVVTTHGDPDHFVPAADRARADDVGRGPPTEEARLIVAASRPYMPAWPRPACTTASAAAFALIPRLGRPPKVGVARKRQCASREAGIAAEPPQGGPHPDAAERYRR